MDADHKSLVFFRPFLPPAVAKPMSCVYWFAYFAAGFSESEVTFACIFTGFAEARLWECRVFSFKIAHASHKSRVSSFTFAHSCRKSHVLYAFVAYFVHICVILSLCVAVCGRQFLSRVDILTQFYGVF